MQLLNRPYLASLILLTGLLFCTEVKASSSVQFPGGGSYASTTDAAVFDFAGSFTIELLFQSSVAHTGTLVSKFRQSSGTPNDDSYHIFVRDDDTLQARIQTTQQLVDLKGDGTVHDGQWHHVALVFDDAADRIELYFDGTMTASQTLSGNLRDTSEPLTLGTVLSGSGAPVPTSFFIGRMDELRFWNTARRGKQAWCLKDVTVLDNTPGLVSYYRFDEGSGSTTADRIAPYENFNMFSGAAFSSTEPPLQSRLSGSGQCKCGDVSGVWNGSTIPVTLVGDTVTILAGDSVILYSHTLTVDSSVDVVQVSGTFRAQGTVADSSRILGQGSTGATVVLSFTNPTTTSLSYTRVSGFASRPLHFSNPANLNHCLLAENGGSIESGAVLTIADSRFTGNDEAAIRLDSGSVDISRKEFINNAGAIQAVQTDLDLDSCTFSGNNNSGSGGALYLELNNASRAEITRSTFTGNHAESGGAVFATGELTSSGSGDSLIIRDCSFRLNTADSAAALYVRDINLVLRNTNLDSNTADIGGGLIASASTSHVCRVRGDSLEFSENVGGGGSAVLLEGIAGVAPVEAKIIHSTFSGNTRAPSTAGAAVCARAIKQISGAEPFLERCVFYDNENSGGASGAVAIETAYDGQWLELRNLTVVLNQADSTALLLRAPTIVRHCIVIENGGIKEILGNSPAVAYCLTSDTEYHGAGGSFYADPAFADFWNRDFHLSAGSPAINRGDPNPLYHDPDGTRADIGAYLAESFSPVWQSVLDVPHDNGRQLMLQWLPSAGDDNRHGIASYAIYRVVNLRLDENYELMATIPAAELPGYGQIVSTLADSNQTGMPYYSYFIRAQSVNPLAFWDTPLDSGYSVDNLSPQTPALVGEEIPAGVALSWTAAPDSDLAYYAIYRADSIFDPDTAIVIYATATDTVLTDSISSGTFSYAVRAVDHNGNFSDASNLVTVDVNAIRPPTGLTIYPLGEYIMLRWQASAGAARYNVYRSGNLFAPDEWLGNTTDTYFLAPVSAIRSFYWVTAERD